MTSKTLLKARTIYKSGGVERVAPSTYHVTSTSKETYVVELTLDRCTCPATGMCSHKGAVRHSEAGGQCEREAIGEVWSLHFCEVHGHEVELAYLDERQETIGYGLDMLRGDAASVLRGPVAEALKKVGRPEQIDRDAVEAAMLAAYPPEELAEHIDPGTLAYDYEDCSFGPVEGWTVGGRVHAMWYCALCTRLARMAA